ncbi:MAG: tRNA (guanosine(46)-N7)-methyltransferase TrmB [Cyanobacteriota bacterium]|nr:tRNA (guanosine(46)-N7)-methyltransferase TrmB [Cyanobacteriota bacterium]
MRQHVNPLSRYHLLPRPLPPLAELFAQPDLPLHLDIGSARGRFLLALAPLEPGRNHLGLEIREPLVAAAEADRLQAGLSNLRFVFGNANVSLVGWLEQLPAGLLQRVTLQFPDPWFKARHHKRRVLQPPLLQALALALTPGAELFVQSDVAPVILPMVALVEASGCFNRPAGDPRPWRPTNPLPVSTERERHVLAQGLPVYRVLFQRNEAPVPPIGALEEAAGAVDNPPIAGPSA